MLVRTNRITNVDLLVDETLFSTSNRLMGIRGNFAEGYSEGMTSIRGTYINGVYDTHPIVYGEDAYGFPLTGQTIVNLPDAQTVRFIVEGEVIGLPTESLQDVTREYVIEEGYTRRQITWTSTKGFVFILEEKRLACFDQPEIFLSSFRLISSNYSGPIEVESLLDGNVQNYVSNHDPRTAKNNPHKLTIEKVITGENQGWMHVQTKHSKLQVYVGVTHSCPMNYEVHEGVINCTTTLLISPKTPYLLSKYSVYTSSLHHASTKQQMIDLINSVTLVPSKPFFDTQKSTISRFWQQVNLSIDSDDLAEESLKYNIYQLNSSGGYNDRTNISAKGLSGEGYEGHYFWDTEIYMFPFFALTQPSIAKNLLLNRYHMLEAAKFEARQLGISKGAKLSWRTINGYECSAYYPAGSAQYHINADVAYAIVQYIEITQDIQFLVDYGFEMLIELGRIWPCLGNFENDQFHLHNVTGPDEYTAVVSDNYYTNKMVQFHTQKISEFYHRYFIQLKPIIERLDLRLEEIHQFEEIAKKMVLLYSDKLNIHVQDSTFLSKKQWDIPSTPKSQFPLLLHYHPLAIYRHQVCKQADTVLSHFLLDETDESILRDSFNYYEPITTHDSSLSKCIFSIMASRIGSHEKAYDYFERTLRIDLDNTHLNTKDGLHLANLGGSYVAFVYGFLGLRIGEYLKIRPTLPHGWRSYQVQIYYQNAKLIFKVSRRLTIDTSQPIKLMVNNQLHFIDSHQEFAL